MERKLRVFDPRDRQITPQQARRYALFEIVHTIVDFSAAFLFVVGSVLFFFEHTKIAGTYGFLVGSLFFAAKPAIRLGREIWLARLDDVDQLAKMAPEGPGAFEKLTDEDGDGVPDIDEETAEKDAADAQLDRVRFRREE